MRLRFMVVTSVMFILFAITAAPPYVGPATLLDQPIAQDTAATPTAAALTGTPQPSQAAGRPISPGPIIGLICVIVTSSVALGFAFSIRRRIDAIAGPDPDREED